MNENRPRDAALVGLPEGGKLGFTALRNLLRLTDGNLGMHLRVLTEADYVDAAREQPPRGRARTLYAATPLGRAMFDRHAQVLREIIADSGSRWPAHPTMRVMEQSGGRHLDFGIFDWIDDAGRDPGESYASRLRLLEYADRAGFWGYHLAEHHGTPLGTAPSPNVFLAAAAARTGRIRLGPLVNVVRCTSRSA